MPDQNNPAFPASPTAPTATSPTDQSAPQTNQPVNPVVTTDLDIPPLPPDFQNIQPTTTPTPMVPPMEKAGDSGSAAPSNLPPIVSTPKKKFGGKRIIATILGVLLLVGGVGAGLVLTQQQQLFNQKASGCTALCLKNATPAECGCNGKQAAGTVTQTRTSQNQTGGGVQTAVTRTSQNQGTTNTTNTSSGSTTGCTSDSQCGMGQVCSGGSCVAGTPANSGSSTSVAPGRTNNTCTNSNDCSTGQSCVNGSCVVSSGSIAPAGGPISCGSSGYSNFDASTVSEPCSGGGYNIEKIAHTGCPSGQTSCWCTSDSSNCTGTSTGGTKTTTTSVAAQCSAVTAYNTGWNAMTAAQLSTVTAGTTINFCVNGNTSAGGFDMAKFTINGVAQAATTTVRPGSTDYCQNYVIPAGVSSFNVTAQIHHATLGWSN